jgi:class 3 adenylate cyclase
MVKVGLPAAHAGIHSGRSSSATKMSLERRATVASRIANHATAGSIFVSDPVAQACPDLTAMFEPLGEVTISGLVDPMMLRRWWPLARS